MQIAIFLGDDGQDEWARIAGTLLHGCLACELSVPDKPSHAVELVESLGDDVRDTVIRAAPFDCILAKFSGPTNARAVQLRTHHDDNGPHLTLEVSERFSFHHAQALVAALASDCSTEKHTSVTIRPSWLAFSPGTRRPHPSLSVKTSVAWGSPFVDTDRWNAAVIAVATALSSMPNLRHLHCSSCSLGAAAATCLPLHSVATLHLQDNELGDTMGFLGADKRKPVFDSFIRHLVSPAGMGGLFQLGINTAIQVCKHMAYRGPMRSTGRLLWRDSSHRD